MLEGAPNLLDTSAPADLRERLHRARADIETAAELEEIRLSLSATSSPDRTAPRTPGHLYADAFRRYGIDVKALEPAEAAARVRHSAIRETLLAFLYDWLYWASEADRDLLRALLDRADDDDWRRAYRDVLLDRDTRKLKELAAAPEALAQPPRGPIRSGRPLARGRPAGGSPGAIARGPAAQSGRLLDQLPARPVSWKSNARRRPSPTSGLRWPCRPSSDQAYVLLGRALLGAGDTDGAIAAFRQARALNPDRFVAADLAKALAPRGGLEEARAAWEDALEARLA